LLKSYEHDLALSQRGRGGELHFEVAGVGGACNRADRQGAMGYKKPGRGTFKKQ